MQIARILLLGGAAPLLLGAPAGNAVCTAPRTLQGVWKGDDAGAYQFAQRGNAIRLVGKATQGDPPKIFRGMMSGDTIAGALFDAGADPGSTSPLTLRVKRTAAGGIAYVERVSGGIGASKWSKPCNRG